MKDNEFIEIERVHVNENTNIRDIFKTTVKREFSKKGVENRSRTDVLCAFTGIMCDQDCRTCPLAYDKSFDKARMQIYSDIVSYNAARTGIKLTEGKFFIASGAKEVIDIKKG